MIFKLFDIYDSPHLFLSPVKSRKQWRKKPLQETIKMI